ncbi:MAG TPA: 16S rRNA (guanine(966)-N(2))-methyltransferase RsmD [Crenotrichaceae bacterium]|nr:16S rRNA (guanine(966)-N(2))-methyltransferase RsmD [Crenotrichaceae bacterium]
MPDYNNSVSIIAGQWRGTKLRVANVSGLRPTSARIRETLFNWLQYDIRASHCLDLFAGSGALGLEAASRGAKSVTLVEANPQLCQQLQQTVERLKAHQVSIVRQNALNFLRDNVAEYNLVFLDPPFDAKLLNPCCHALENNGWLADNAKIYIETDKRTLLEELPDNWQQLRSKVAGEVAYHLFQR